MSVIVSLIMLSDLKHRRSFKQFIVKSVATFRQCKRSRTKESNHWSTGG